MNMDDKSNSVTIHDILSRIDENCCPNFFLSGKSYSTLEKATSDLVDEIQAKGLINSMGSKKAFSIVIPYFSESKAAKSFVDRLAESISIARDCYYQYRGIVIIEFDREWSKKGMNNSLRTVFDYMKSQKELCFILIAVDDKESNNISTIFNELCNSMDLWIPIEVCPSSSPEQCLEYVESTAKHFGLEIPSDVKKALLQMFQQRDETDISNHEVALRIVKQILLKRFVYSNDEPEINISEISYLNSFSKNRSSGRIGFVSDDR